jgi:hypothetical protein
MATIQAEKFSLELLQTAKDHGFFDTLYKNEKSIDWLAFAAKLWRIDHRTSTVMINCNGVCNFRKFRIAKGSTLQQTIDNIKAQTNGLAYKILDDFVSWCDTEQGYMPRTTRNFFNCVVNLFKFCEIELNENKLSDIRMPMPKALNDDYPPVEEMRAIDNAATLETRGYYRLIVDTGFEPIDAAKLQTADFYFDEKPVRISKDRQKTGKKLTGFLSDSTAQIINQIIETENKQPQDYIFSKNYTPLTVKQLSSNFKYAVVKAGFGKMVKYKTGHAAVPNKIEGHTYSKYHLKVFKKRWFTMAVASGIPEYVAQGMLGRKKYLDEYMRLPLDKKAEFAKKILKIVEIYPSETDKQEVLAKASEMLGIAVDEKTINALKGLVANWQKLPDADKARLLGGQ